MKTRAMLCQAITFSCELYTPFFPRNEEVNTAFESSRCSSKFGGNTNITVGWLKKSTIEFILITSFRRPLLQLRDGEKR